MRAQDHCDLEGASPSQLDPSQLPGTKTLSLPNLSDPNSAAQLTKDEQATLHELGLAIPSHVHVQTFMCVPKQSSLALLSMH